MKTTDIKAGKTYRFGSGILATVERVFGRGRNRQVRYTKTLQDGSRIVSPHYAGIKAFARWAVEEV